MSEKIPQIRAVGRGAEEMKERYKKDIIGKLTEHREGLPPVDLERIKKYELEKSQEQLEIIEMTNRQTNELMESLGLKPFDITADNIHIINKRFLNDFGYDEERAAGQALWHKQGILILKQDLQDNPLYFANVVFHEILHLKQHLTIEVSEDKNGKPKVALYRWGVYAESPEKSVEREKVAHSHFGGLVEAIVATEEWRNLPKLMKDPLFKDEVEWMNSEEGQQIRKAYAEGRGVPGESVFLYSKRSSEKIEDSLLGVTSREIEATVGSYPNHVKLMHYISEEIFSEFSDKYRSADAVFNEFLKANFTGQLLTIGRLVEATFGKNSFRSLGEMTNDGSSAITKLGTFKKLRQEVLSQKAKEN